MASYSLALKTYGSQPSGFIWSLVASQTNVVSVYEIGVYSNAVTTSASATLGRLATLGTPRNTFNLLPMSDNPAAKPSLSVVATEWSKTPTLATQMLRRYVQSTTIGSGMLFVFPDGLGIPANNGIGLIMASTTFADLWCQIDE